MSELELLIAEQAKDDHYRIDLNGTISLDAIPSGADMPRGRQTVSDERHGSLYCYVKLRCRCAKCRNASAEYARTRRRRLACG